jgi:anaerobic selenocysteine-containing dehydrogenase
VRALTSLDLLVISDNVRSTDTIGAGPHVLLPAAAWGEKDGTVTNSERLNAGTNCGSCLPELRRMIAARAQDMAHAVLPA